ncbi:MAG: hypothetical protein MI867_01425 [Pseudomonadales bacterium]|nr:hypothetical protein [Pseudomonadales bacterium]
MRIVGILLAIGGLALLYTNSLLLGMTSFILGGFLAKGLFVSIKSIAMVTGVLLLAFGYHNEFTPLMIGILVVCVVIVFFSKRRVDSSGAMEWGCDWDLQDIFGDGGDGGCDGGGGD